MAGTARLVVERELRESFRRRSFWLVVGLFVLASTALVVVPEFIDRGGSDERRVGVVGENAAFAGALAELAPAFDLDVDIDEVSSAEAARAGVEEGEIDVAVDLTADPVVVITESADSTAVMLVSQAVTVSTFSSRLAEAGLTDEQIAGVFAASDPAIDELEPVDDARQGVASIVTLVLYLLLLLLSTTVANGVAIEKSNRVSEVLLAIVPARHLLFGKVVGVAIVGILTLVVGTLPIAVRAAVGGSLPDGTGAAVAASAAWFVMGLALYLTAAAALGALVDRQEEVGATIAPLSGVLIVAYFVGVTSPDTAVATVLAYVPFTSPMVMPARIGLGVTSTVELIVSLGLGVVAVVVIARFAEKVYRRAIVRTGRKLRLRQVVGA
ncbi:MAG TPA: ABC transporter permease [Ilumatobacteraceae bacterium]|nr:ABC transporter permease [Ilumatobacteraceae bacterium]